MPWGAKKGERRGGRQKGSRNKRTHDVEAYARSIVEDPEVQAMMRKQAQQGTLPAPLMQMLHAYAYGKPVERVELSGDEDKPVQVTIRRAH
jgi:hypothetical protein